VIIESYLPAMMPKDQVEAAVKAKIAELGITAKSDSGKAIGALMKDLKGKADGADVKAAVDSLLV
jgi:uncharacterized protein YqeY